MLKDNIRQFLEKKEFISVATSDLNGNPNAAPKLLLKTEGNFIYLIDYSISKTWQNLKMNPRASLSFMDTNELIGYQINGSVQLIDSGEEFDKILKELVDKEIILSSKRIAEGVVSGKKHNNFELNISQRFVILKIKIEEVAEIWPKGQITREKV